jgi:hypothetical protein
MGLVGKINLHASMEQQLVVIREANRYISTLNGVNTLVQAKAAGADSIQ